MYRLIYKSRATQPLDWNNVSEILNESEENNAAATITGFLLASKTHFLQVIEGTFEDVNKVFLHIARDPRHDELQILSYEVIDARLFETWAMKGIGVFDVNTALARKLIEKYGEQEGGVKFPLES